MSAPQSIDESRLGLTAAEIQILRQQQQIAQQQATANRDAAAGRGRGTSRHSQPSSRAASAASSQGGQGRLVLDPRTLQLLYSNLDHLMHSIQRRLDDLDEATERSVRASADRANQTMASADEQIKRMRRIIAEMDKLEEECKRIKRIRDVVKQVRARVDAAGDRLGASQPSGRDHGHGGGHSGRHASDRHDSRHSRH